MHYKKQLYAWATAMLLCAALAAALGSCGSGGDDGGGTGMSDGPTATIDALAQKLVECGYSNLPALTARLQADLSVASREADGQIFPTAAKEHYEKLIGLALGCMVEAPCADVTAYAAADFRYCEGADVSEESALVTCLTNVETKYASQAPGAKFKCSDGTALEEPAEAVCDGVEHCADASDESAKACALINHTVCDGRAVPAVWRCDREAQCTDGADQRDCFECGEGEVTLKTNLCNGFAECGSGADEVGCGEPIGCPGGPSENGEDDAGTILAGLVGMDGGLGRARAQRTRPSLRRLSMRF